MRKGLIRALNSLLLAVFIYIIVVLLQNGVSARSQQSLPYHWCMVISLALICIYLSLRHGFDNKKSPGSSLAHRHLFTAFMGFYRRTCWLWLYILCVYIFYNIYYKSASDLWTIDYTARYLIGVEQNITWIGHYYSLYPNNALLTVLYAFGLGINKILGGYYINDGIFIFTMVNCAISVIVTKWIHDYSKAKFHSTTVLLSTLISIIMLCLNPFNVWLYSDVFSVWIPLCIYITYHNQNIGKTRKIFWLCFLGRLGIAIKAQSVIILISILLISLLSVRKNDLRWKKIHQVLISGLVGFVIASVIATTATNYLLNKVEANRDQSLGAAHLFMMGLNEDSSGGWNGEDVQLSGSIEDRKERIETQLKVAFGRLDNMGVRGTMHHLYKKTRKIFLSPILDYGTGTGDWYDVIYDRKNDGISILLRSLFYNDGDNFPIWVNCMAVIWMAVLLLVCITTGFNIKENNNYTSILGIALLGLVMYEILFEAQGRHLYCMLPVFICYSFTGLDHVGELLNTKCRKRS